jgi:hypothetical protein
MVEANKSDTETTVVVKHGGNPLKPQQIVGKIVVGNSAGLSMDELPPLQNGVPVEVTKKKPIKPLKKPRDIGIPRWLESDLKD